jgi:hypothetical protein
MNSTSPSVLHDLFASSFARYLAVRPTGLQMPHGLLVSSLRVTLRDSRPARTFYRDHQPQCRSLDGLRSVTQDRACADCLLRSTCTPQIHIDLLHEAVPYRLLLAYTSARNFLLFLSHLGKQGRGLPQSDVILSVLNRGRWGELRFISSPSSNPLTQCHPT